MMLLHSIDGTLALVWVVLNVLCFSDAWAYSFPLPSLRCCPVCDCHRFLVFCKTCKPHIIMCLLQFCPIMYGQFHEYWATASALLLLRLPEADILMLHGWSHGFCILSPTPCHLGFLCRFHGISGWRVAHMSHMYLQAKVWTIAYVPISLHMACSCLWGCYVSLCGAYTIHFLHASRRIQAVPHWNSTQRPLS